MALNDESLNDAIVRHYARQQAGLPPMPPDPQDSLSFIDAMVAHRRYLEEHYPEPATAPVALPDPPPAE